MVFAVVGLACLAGVWWSVFGLLVGFGSVCSDRLALFLGLLIEAVVGVVVGVVLLLRIIV